MVDWFQNHTYSKERVGHARSPKKLRAIGGIEVFEQQYKVDVMTKFAAKANTGANVYKEVLRDMYQDAEPDIKAACEDEAKASNASRNKKPPAAEIFA